MNVSVEASGGEETPQQQQQQQHSSSKAVSRQQRQQSGSKREVKAPKGTGDSQQPATLEQQQRLYITAEKQQRFELRCIATFEVYVQPSLAAAADVSSAAAPKQATGLRSQETAGRSQRRLLLLLRLLQQLLLLLLLQLLRCYCCR